MEDDTSKQGTFVNNLKVAIGAATGALFSETLCYPLDTINTWVKTWPDNSRIHQIVKHNYKKDGIRAFYNGVNTQFYVTFIPAFFYFLSYEITNMYARKILEKTKEEKWSKYTPMVTATVSEFASLLILVPMDALKKRYQINSDSYQYKSVRHGLSDMIKKEGYLRLFKASPLYLINLTVFNTLLFQSYETLRIDQMKKERKENKDLTILDSVKNSLKATLFATILTNPMDVIITKYQVIDSSVSKLSVRSLLVDVYKRDGIKGLNRGVTIKCFYRAVDTCIYLPIYEELRKRYGYDFARSTD